MYELSCDLHLCLWSNIYGNILCGLQLERAATDQKSYRKVNLKRRITEIEIFKNH